MNYSELTDDQKTTAIELTTKRWQDDWLDYGHDSVLDDYRTKLTKMGFKDIKFQWDVSYCQGSGASFTAVIDVVPFLANQKATNEYRSAWWWAKAGEIEPPTIVNDPYSHYNHYNSVNLELPYDDAYTPQKATDQVKDIASWAFEVAQEEMQALHKALEDSYEWSWKSENIVEYIKDEGLDFDIETSTELILNY